MNINLFPSVRPVSNEQYIDILIEEGVKVVETSGRSPEPVMKQLKDGGVKVMHKTAGVRFAQTVERLGVDIVAVVGFECGGHPPINDVTSLVLIPLTAAAVKIPVVAGGGIADARGLVAALALGAEGVLMGTRFMATTECPMHPKVKEHLVSLGEGDTTIVQRSIRTNARAWNNEVAQKVLEMEARGATLEQLMPLISGLKEKEIFETGNLNAGLLHCGEAVGLVNRVMSVREVIQDMVQGAQAIRKRLNAAIG